MHIEAVNLTNCDREPIHVPGSIQPHGILIVLESGVLGPRESQIASSRDWVITQVSRNTEALIGIPYQDLLGQPLSMLIDADQVALIDPCLDRSFDHVNPLKLSVQARNRKCEFNGIIHRSLQNKLILELEPCSLEEEQKNNFFGFYQKTRSVLHRISQAETLSELSSVIVQQVRSLTGFDRVMVYRFDEDGSGTVIAEDKAEQLTSYLGLHYPDSDIPKQAKHLYCLNWLRLIPEIAYQPVPIEALLDSRPGISPHSETEQLASQSDLLDLSLSVLRSVSPIHIEYLTNMGVGASMSISLIKNKQLWGLIACHHTTPRFVTYEVRTICEFLGQVMSMELATKEANENLDHKIRVKSIQSRFIENLSKSDNFTDGLVQDRINLLSLVEAEGAAVYTDGHLIRVGKTPNEGQILNLVEWLSDRFQNHVFVTDTLSKLYPQAAEFKDVASGLLALSITQIQKNYVLWFRPELLQSVNWAGDPKKPQRVEEDGTLTIFPRHSFELWQETVACKSLPWQPYEIEGAIELRSAIVGIVLRKADELAALNVELQRSNNELDAFAYIASHDLKEPLRGIHNYSTFLLEDYATVLDEDGVSKLETLVRLTKRMEDLINSLLHFSRLGRHELNLQSLDLNQLINNVTEVLMMSQRGEAIQIQVSQPLPVIQGDQVLIEEVLTNLISNALKYNDQPEKWVEIGLVPERVSRSRLDLLEPVQPSQFYTFYVRDNGIGIREKHLDTIFRIFKRLHAANKYGGGTGAGLTIVKKIVERHGGEIWVESDYGTGSTFYFTLPA